MHLNFGGGDGDKSTLLLFCGNAVLGAVSTVLHTYGLMGVLQCIALISSIVASWYVAIDHRHKIKWKKKQDQGPKNTGSKKECDCEKNSEDDGE